MRRQDIKMSKMIGLRKDRDLPFDRSTNKRSLILMPYFHDMSQAEEFHFSILLFLLHMISPIITTEEFDNMDIVNSGSVIGGRTNPVRYLTDNSFNVNLLTGTLH